MAGEDQFAALEPVEGVTTTDWAGQNARSWERVAAQLEAQLAPVGDLLHVEAAVGVGEAVLDVGCGRGATTRRAAEAAGPTGRVAGIDVADNLIEAARLLTAPDLRIEWIVGDAQHHQFAERFDVVISRFGVMFFDEARDAFANLRRATAPDGRLCAIVWQRRDRSEVMQRPLDVALAAAGSSGWDAEVEPPDRGAFAFGDASVVVPTLEAGGWSDVALDPRTLPMYLGGPGPVGSIVETVMTVGPVRRLLDGAPADVVADVRHALHDDLVARHDGVGVRMTGAVAVLTARAR